MRKDTDSIIKFAWHDKTSFEKIYRIYGVKEKEIIIIMRKNLNPKTFRIWRKRVRGRKSKHEKKLKNSLNDLKNI